MATSEWETVRGKLNLVEKWAKDGLREDQIAKNLGVAVSSLEEYKRKYPQMLKALNR